MGFRFSYVCDLLSSLEGNRLSKATSAARARNPDFCTISSWCLNHSQRIHDKGTDLLALLSCLFPDKRPDRVYWLQHASLARIIGRCLYLGASRLKDLSRWQISGSGDLAECVQNVMSQAENQIAPGQEVTVEEIDAALQQIASRCRFSGSRVRRSHAAVDVDEVLGSIYRRLSSRDAKWLTRMILKSYGPVELPVNYILKSIHFLLPHMLLFQDSFEAAVDLLKSPTFQLFPSRPQPDFAKLLGNKALESFVPRLGVKVGRPEYYKARSIKHCCNMINRRRVSLERKYDGEYCQIHVDITKGHDCFQIFSKSGKDSTYDRIGIHDAIKHSLGIGEAHCKVSRRCILEGELLVWDDRSGKVLEFHKLRKFVTRSGVLIGADLDSQPKPYEHLMIVFFDILLLDDDVCLSKPHSTRRLLLKETVKVLPGRADISEQEIVDFSRQDGSRLLRLAFTKSIAERWEGLVIKACDEPYFSVLSPDKGDGYTRWIKLKKDYIPGLGDTADFALIGARYESKDVPSLSKISALSWTQFFIGCLDNKDDVVRLHASPRFRIVDIIGSHSLSVNDMQVLNQWGKFVACDVDSNTAYELHSIHNSLPAMDVVFKTPFVVEMLGSGFDKPGNAQYYVLRFPRVLKIHWDRTYEDAISFSELQDLAEKARSVPEDELQEENAMWYDKVEATNKKNGYIVDRSQSTSSTITSCTSPLSKSGSLISPDLTPLSSKEVGAYAHTRHLDKTPPTNSLHTLKRKISSTHSQSELTPTPFSKRLRVSVLTSSTNMEHSISDLRLYSQHLRVRGSPIPRSWTTSIGSSRSNPSSRPLSKMGSRATSPLRENPNVLLRAPPNYVQPLPSNFVRSDLGQDHCQISSTAPAPAPTTRYCSIEEPIEQNDLSASISTNNILPPPRPLPTHPLSPLATIPMYCGEFGFVENLFRQTPREFTFSALHFVQSLGFPYYRGMLRASNPAAADSQIALGIVLVNIRDPANTLTTQLCNVGNQVVAQLCELHSILPSSGKIFFLDRRVLNAGGSDGIHNELFLLNDWWAQYGMQYYYATISWSLGKDVDQFPQSVGEPFGHAAQSDSRKATGVVSRFQPSDVESIGEFVSIRPTVHIDGDHFYAPYTLPENIWHENLSPILQPGSRIGTITNVNSECSSSAFI
ncbi:hypothetical protein UA08_00530 [Talaromyces atroroseus]|uniref:ATP-dependent DNA ligase family profile domain-containing protein n=1 Tax=Talaromyces atroroseus TaxID=1441469 RepID=A0A225ARG8_TALAT|nr:hypothetical protein UA08_00530 [Talaromyces atroroseus]OKL64181.1 hypothetical protein UA08_00530 [Talaromyces atroroseus]